MAERLEPESTVTPEAHRLTQSRGSKPGFLKKASSEGSTKQKTCATKKILGDASRIFGSLARYEAGERA